MALPWLLTKIDTNTFSVRKGGVFLLLPRAGFGIFGVTHTYRSHHTKIMKWKII